jgi:alanyl-tRNA synthetase
MGTGVFAGVRNAGSHFNRSIAETTEKRFRLQVALQVHHHRLPRSESESSLAMTERIYYTDSYQRQFTATLEAIRAETGGTLLQLDRTCFYPTSGGQPFDRGQLAEWPVVNVFVDEAGAVQHLVAEAVEEVAATLAVGATVKGTIDWPRRHDHMQQHTGQHLLSQVFYQQCAAETVAVHFGAESATLDLAVAQLSAGEIDAVEAEANALIYAALPIRAYFVDESALASVPLRRPPTVTDTIRIVEIEDFDYSACGGTHCHSTAEVAIIKIVKSERQRNQLRVTFLCGRRAYQDYARKHQLLSEAANLFQNEIEQVPVLIERNQAQIKELERALETSRASQLTYEAAALAQNAEEIAGLRLVIHATAQYDAVMLKRLASQLQQLGVVALVASTANDKSTLCFAGAAEQLTPHNLHMGQLLRATLQAFDGKGGGKADFAQGGGIMPGQVTAALHLARQQLLTTLHSAPVC